jgi:hypothetical protein
LVWTGFLDAKGYGSIVSYAGGKKMLKAHRVAYALYNGGHVPFTNLLVCHHCDNPSCVRPDHLFVGTAVDNMQDCIKKGRFRAYKNSPFKSGELHCNSKLTKKQVYQIRKFYKMGKYNQVELGRIFGVVQSTISCIVNLKRWQ